MKPCAVTTCAALALCLTLTAPASPPEPSLDEIVAACAFLKPGDIPSDTFLPPSSALYVATAADGGNDAHSGLSLDAPLEHLHKAIEYANNNPITPLTIYLRRGAHYYKDSGDYEYQRIERGHLYITSLPGEAAVIRPYYWPGNPSSWGGERAFEIFGPYEDITLDNLAFEGWSIIFNAGAPLDGQPLRRVTLKNISASGFTRRNGEPDYLTAFIETAYLDDDIYGEGKNIFDNPDTADYQIEDLILSGISVEGLDLAVNVGDENDANIRGMRIHRFNIINPPGQAGNSASDAFAIVNSSNVLLDHCHIENINDDGVDTKGYNVAVVNCFITGTGRNAVKFWRNGEIINTILYNVTDIDDGAIVVKDGPLRIVHSVLLGHPSGYAATYGYDEPTSQPLEIVNSIFGEVKSLYTGTENLTALNNRWFGILDDAAILEGRVNADDAAALNAVAGCSGNAMSTNQFTDPTGRDFSTRDGSEWRDAGATGAMLLPAFDFYGRSRIGGSAPDIGPVEFHLPGTQPEAWASY